MSIYTFEFTLFHIKLKKLPNTLKILGNFIDIFYLFFFTKDTTEQIITVNTIPASTLIAQWI